MSVIKNYSTLNTSPQRKIVLDLIDVALTAITPKNILEKNIALESDILTIQENTYDLKKYNRIFVIGFGKGSSGICKELEEILGDRLTQGFDIDVVDATFTKISYTKGTHPLPSQTNIDFTKQVLDNLTGLSEKDLVLVVICGGGSALFELPTLPLEKIIQLSKDLLRSGATISEMNALRKHLSKVKGGGLAYHLFPATVASLIFSDVPGNDLSVIASGPTVVDTNTLADTQKILKKYGLEKDLSEKDFVPTPTDPKYFAHVVNILMVSNMTALTAMQQYADAHGQRARIYTDKLQGDAKIIGKQLINETKTGEILLAGGETTVKVQGNGIGGRNQTLILASLPYLDESTVIAAFDSDGWDFTTFAGAIGDTKTVEKVKELGLDEKNFLDNDDSTKFFQKAGDGIDTGKLESNVSDLMIVLKSEDVRK